MRQKKQLSYEMNQNIKCVVQTNISVQITQQVGKALKIQRWKLQQA